MEQERFVVKPFSMGQPSLAEEPVSGETPYLGDSERSASHSGQGDVAVPRLHRASAFTPATSFSVRGTDA